MNYLSSLSFFIVLILGIGYFVRNSRKLIRNIKLGISVDRFDNPKKRWKNMIMIALGQSKMVRRPIAGILHIVVYVGFVIINIELLEIIVDGLFGTHRVLAFLGIGYNFMIAFSEVLAFLVLISVIVFWMRRNVLKLNRFMKKEMNAWPKEDANIILYFEMILMVFFLSFNATDFYLQYHTAAPSQYIQAGTFPISQYIAPLFNNLEIGTVVILERIFWWLHIIGILCFLNYLYFSKHLHILLAFPNTYFANLNPQGQLDNLESVTREVKAMMYPDLNPLTSMTENLVPDKFGASDATDLSWAQLLSAYTCTECGRCTSVCPANITGKELSPRKIMMDTRDRIEEIGKNMDSNKGIFVDDGKNLFNYVTHEELWACTSCNACVEICPININPLSIIMDMRRYLVMEQSAAPVELNNMMTNIENNGAPWQYNQMDRLNWKNE